MQLQNVSQIFMNRLHKIHEINIKSLLGNPNFLLAEIPHDVCEIPVKIIIFAYLELLQVQEHFDEFHVDEKLFLLAL